MKRNRSTRGVSLIEAMCAAAVLAIGILGSFSGMVLASKQNSSAARLGRASSAAGAIRAGLEVKSFAQLNGTGGPFNAASCTGAAAVLALTDGLSSSAPANTCVVDLDAYDTGASAINKIVPGYTPADSKVLRRVAIVWDSPAPVEIRTVVVVVSFMDGLGRRYVKQAVGVYNSAVNKVGTEI